MSFSVFRCIGCIGLMRSRCLECMGSSGVGFRGPSLRHLQVEPEGSCLRKVVVRGFHEYLKTRCLALATETRLPS